MVSEDILEPLYMMWADFLELGCMTCSIVLATACME
jgi:hypothetical protein